MIEPNVREWLMAGDPAIRWQVLGDLCEVCPAEVAAERQKVAAQGWGARLLSFQESSGRWAGQLYNHKWLSTTYSLLLLRQMGLDPANAQAHHACRELLEGGFQSGGVIRFAKTAATIDNGVTGMVLSLLAYFGYPDARLHQIAEYLISQQAPDGHWEPEAGKQNPKYALDGTLAVMEGLHAYQQRFPAKASAATEALCRGRETLLRRRLYKSEQDGTILDKKMILFAFPPRWHYDVLVALDFFQDCRAAKDERLQDAINLLKSKRKADGRWNLQNRHAGKTFFEMETVGQPSRWNTLRALRVLKWWEGA